MLTDIPSDVTQKQLEAFFKTLCLQSSTTMFQSVSLLPSLKMAYVVFPSVSSAKSVFNVRGAENFTYLVTQWKFEFEWKGQNWGAVLSKLLEGNILERWRSFKQPRRWKLIWLYWPRDQSIFSSKLGDCGAWRLDLWICMIFIAYIS